MKSLIVLVSYHHNNTQKIAEVMAKVLSAEIKSPQQTSPEELQQYDLVGFGSGNYFGKHHKDLLKLADKLPQFVNKKAFIFSTSGDTRKVPEAHLPLKEKLQSKGYKIEGEFNCAGFDTYGALKLVGGIKKGRPNAEDLKHAEEFALKLSNLYNS
jgi:flavodoxin